MEMNERGFVNIILVAVVTVLIGVGGYFTFVKKSELVDQQPAPATTLTNTQIPPVSTQSNSQLPTKTTTKTTTTTNAVKDWKIYTNTKYGIEISYPSSWPNPKEEKNPGYGIVWDYLINFTRESTGNDVVMNIPGFDIEINKVSPDISISENLTRGLSIKSTYTENNCPKIYSDVKIGSGNYSAQEVIILSNNPCYREEYFYGVKKGDYFYKIIPVPVNGIGSAGYNGKIEVSKTLPEFDQILSTLKITSISTTNTTNEKASGIIKSVYTQSGKNYIDIDYIEFNPNWAPGGMSGVSIYSNSNPKIRTFEISPSAKFIVGSPTEFEFITFSEFQKTPDNQKFSPWVWDIIIVDGVVVEFKEHFIS